MTVKPEAIAFFSLFTALAPLVAQSPAAWALERYGSWTPNFGGDAPRLWTNSVPHDGSTSFALTTTHGAPLSLAIAALSLAAVGVNVAGLELNVDVSASVLLGPALLDSVGNGTVPLFLAPSPSLVDIEVYAQTFVLDASSISPLGFTSSQGLRFRTQRPAQVLLPCDVVSTPNDPIFAIDPISGTVNTVPTSITTGYYAAYTRDGTRGLVVDRVGKRVLVFDTTGPVPVFSSMFAMAQPPAIDVQPVAGRVTPNGQFLLLPVAGLNQPSYSVEVWNVDPSSPAFGTLVGTVPQVSHAGSDLRISPDSRRAYLLNQVQTTSTFTTFSEIDIDPASPTFLTTLATIVPTRTSGGLTHGRGVAISPDGARAYLGLWAVTSSPSQIAVVDLATMTQLDCDPTTPQLDNLIDVAVPVSPDMDLRGEELVVGESGSPARLHFVRADPADPAFRTVRSVALPATPKWIVVSPAGDLVYVVMGSDLQEIETTGLSTTHTWSFPGHTLQLPAIR